MKERRLDYRFFLGEMARLGKAFTVELNQKTLDDFYSALGFELSNLEFQNGVSAIIQGAWIRGTDFPTPVDISRCGSIAVDLNKKRSESYDLLGFEGPIYRWICHHNHPSPNECAWLLDALGGREAVKEEYFRLRSLGPLPWPAFQKAMLNRIRWDLVGDTMRGYITSDEMKQELLGENKNLLGSLEIKMIHKAIQPKQSTQGA